jgi:hypothetical protein
VGIYAIVLLYIYIYTHNTNTGLHVLHSQDVLVDTVMEWTTLVSPAATPAPPATLGVLLERCARRATVAAQGPRPPGAATITALQQRPTVTQARVLALGAPTAPTPT